MGCAPTTRVTSLAALLAAALLAGCAGPSGGWREYLFGVTTAPQGTPQVAYVTADRTKVYREPDETSAVLGLLTLHEKIERYQSQGGFAYVEAQGDVSGWVRERELAAARPRVRPAPQAAEPPAPAPSETAAPPDSAAPETEPPAPEEPEPLEPEPSVFDPY
jgi:hypothetical protein